MQFLEPRNGGGEQRGSFNQQPSGAGFGNQGSNPFGQSSNSGNQGNSGFTKNDDPFSNVGQPIDISGLTIYRSNTVNLLVLTKNGGK